jgi:ADP-ribosylglycohydrolase/CheY-like chemotaxis protein
MLVHLLAREPIPPCRIWETQTMNRTNILLLEDDADHLHAFKAAVTKLGPPYQLHIWRDATRMIAECHEALADAALISLDHDLNKEHSDSPDPGDGLEVAEFLSRLPPICPVILHTSNADRVWSMHNAFRFGGWEAERVAPMGTEWIEQSWLPLSRGLLEKVASSEVRFFKPHRPADQSRRLSRALLSLHGLAIGDGIGEMMFGRPDRACDMVMQNQLPAGPWWHTDDTEMAISIVEILRLLGSVHQDALARQFMWRYDREPDRGYGSGARRQLRMMLEGVEWRVTSREAFDGQGSLGNGSAMRVAPVGAWFADDLDRVVNEARASSMVTHMHAEGVAGAIAIAAAAAMAWQIGGNPSQDSAVGFFKEVHNRTPDGATRRGVAHAFELRHFESPQAAARILGNGSCVTCPDTVPFAVWAAAKFLGKYREAIAATASVGGDVDTNCAIVGGIVALSTDWAGLPNDWLGQMEPLPFGQSRPRS